MLLDCIVKYIVEQWIVQNLKGTSYGVSFINIQILYIAKYDVSSGDKGIFICYWMDSIKMQMYSEVLNVFTQG